MPRLAHLLIVPLVALAAPARAADPVLHVRARLRVDLEAIERVPGGLFVRGSLRDDATDDPVPGRTVAISVDGDNGFYHYAEPTGPDGGFAWRVPLPLGTYRLRLAAGGDDDYVPAPPLERTIDVARRTPRLRLSVPARLDARAATLHAVVEGEESDGEGPPRAFDGRATVAAADGPPVALRFVAGRAEADLPGPLGRAGDRVTVVARSKPDELRNAARATASLLLTTATRVTLAADADAVAPDGRLAVSGLARDEDGPVAGARVLIGADEGRALQTAITDGDGRFVAVLDGRALAAAAAPPGYAFVEARLQPNEDWRDPSASPVLTVHLAAAAPGALWPFVVPPALTLLGVGLFLAVRDRRWRARLRVRRVRRAAALPPPAPGLTESRPRLLSSLRSRADHGLTGIVVDAVDDAAIAGATLVARTAAGERRIATADGRGRFALEELPAGRLVVEIAAPGYVAERFSRALPHRGELRGARVRLVPVRARIFDAWRRAAGPLCPPGRAAASLTPRELAELVAARSLVPNEPLVALTALVESAVWSGRLATSDDLVEAERLAAALKAESG